MRILKIIDGFITNSSTQSTTILFAVKKGVELDEIFHKIGKQRYPEVFYWFSQNKNELEEFAKIHCANFAYLDKDYELWINIIPDFYDDRNKYTEEEYDKIFFKHHDMIEEVGIV